MYQVTIKTTSQKLGDVLDSAIGCNQNILLYVHREYVILTLAGVATPADARRIAYNVRLAAPRAEITTVNYESGLSVFNI